MDWWRSKCNPPALRSPLGRNGSRLSSHHDDHDCHHDVHADTQASPVAESSDQKQPRPDDSNNSHMRAHDPQPSHRAHLRAQCACSHAQARLLPAVWEPVSLALVPLGYCDRAATDEEPVSLALVPSGYCDRTAADDHHHHMLRIHIENEHATAACDHLYWLWSKRLWWLTWLHIASHQPEPQPQHPVQQHRVRLVRQHWPRLARPPVTMTLAEQLAIAHDKLVVYRLAKATRLFLAGADSDSSD